MVNLIQWENNDFFIHSLVSLLNDKRMNENKSLNIPFPYTKENACSFLEYIKCPKIQSYAISYNNDIVGQISYTEDNNNPNSVFLGIWIGINYRKKGIAVYAIKELIKKIPSKYDEIYAGISDINLPMQKILQKCEFIKTNYKYEISVNNKSFLLIKMIYRL